MAYNIVKLNLWATPVNHTSTTDWQMANKKCKGNNGLACDYDVSGPYHVFGVDGTGCATPEKEEIQISFPEITRVDTKTIYFK